jgi:hypothetical protein
MTRTAFLRLSAASAAAARWSVGGGLEPGAELEDPNMVWPPE